MADTTGYIRHDIAPELVATTIQDKIATHEQERIRFKIDAANTLASYQDVIENGHIWNGRPPEGPDYVDPMIDEWNAQERDHYALVRIIEITGKNRPRKPFFLVYGNDPDDASGSRSGGFSSFDEAQSWFIRQGR